MSEEWRDEPLPLIITGIIVSLVWIVILMGNEIAWREKAAWYEARISYECGGRK